MDGASPQLTFTLPDGAERAYPAGVTAAEIAADIAPSTRQARDQRHARGPPRGPRLAAGGGRRARHQHREGRGRVARADPPRLRPRHGPSGAGAVAGRPRHHRTRDRERLVLRLRPRGALHPRGSGRHRGPDARDRRRARPRANGGLGPRARARPLRGPRALQGGAHRGDPRGSADPHVLARRLAGPLPRAPSPAHRPASRRRLQADARLGRLLARRRHRQAAPAHLRRGLPLARGAQGPPEHARGGRAARPPPPGPPDGSVPHAGGGAGPGVLAPLRLDHVRGAPGLHAPDAARGRLRRGQHPPGGLALAVGGVGPLGQVPRSHVRRRGGRGARAREGGQRA